MNNTSHTNVLGKSKVKGTTIEGNHNIRMGNKNTI